jgi:hypothetical protein
LADKTAKTLLRLCFTRFVVPQVRQNGLIEPRNAFLLFSLAIIFEMSSRQYGTIFPMTKNQQTYLGVGVALAVIILFFVIMGGGLPQPAAVSLSQETDTMNQNQSFPVSDFQKVTELHVQDVVVGTGKEATPGSTVVVEYVGAFTDGTVFDTSRGRAPFTFKLGAGEVIAGWDQGVAGMKVGGKRLLAVPSSLGYGEAGRGPIPGGATLLFEVELLDVK